MSNIELAAIIFLGVMAFGAFLFSLAAYSKMRKVERLLAVTNVRIEGIGQEISMRPVQVTIRTDEKSTFKFAPVVPSYNSERIEWADPLGRILI